MAKKKTPKAAAVTLAMKKAGAAVLASAPELPAEDLAAAVYHAMVNPLYTKK